MTYKTLYVKDAYINTVIYDDSAVVIPDAILPKRLTILQPIFSGKGKANIRHSKRPAIICLLEGKPGRPTES